MAVIFDLLTQHSNVVFAVALLVIPLYMLAQDNKANADKKRIARKEKTDEVLEPPLLPYWIPWLAHAPSFLLSNNRLYESAISHFGSIRPFRLRLAGETIYILTDPADARALFKHTRELTFDPFVLDVVRDVHGISSVDVEPLVRDRGGGVTLTNEAHGYFHSHLLPGPNGSLAQIQAHYTTQLNAHLSRHATGSVGELFPWLMSLFTHISTDSLMGPSFLARAPNAQALVDAIATFDEGHMYLLYQLPSIFPVVTRARAARTLLHTRMEEYLYTDTPPHEERADLIWNRQKRFVDVDLQHRIAAALQVMILWSFITNSVRTAYWTLQHILADTDLAAAVVSEIDRAGVCDADGNIINHAALVHVNHCPTLVTAINEALRTGAGSASSRVVEHDVVLNNRWHLRRGAKVLTPIIHVHRDRSVWGADADQFRASRWNDKDFEKRLGASYRPFGGGESFCPGRVFAKWQVAGFVGGVLGRWKVGMLREGGLPVEDRDRPVIGMLDPVGKQPRIVLQKRVWT